MERFYDGDQEQLFSEARVINPFRKAVIARPKVIICIFVFLFLLFLVFTIHVIILYEPLIYSYICQLLVQLTPKLCQLIMHCSEEAMVLATNLSICILVVQSDCFISQYNIVIENPSLHIMPHRLVKYSGKPIDVRLELQYNQYYNTLNS